MVNEGPKDAEPTGDEAAEVERLRAERDGLRAEVESLEARPKRRHRVRRILAPLLVALTVLVFTVTVPAAWGARTVLNTDRYVATVAPLASDPAVQESIATRLTDQVLVGPERRRRAREHLPEQIAFLAAPLTNAVRGFVQDQVLKVVQSDAFETFWVEANRFVHTQVLAVLRGEGETISVREGKVLLNLMPLVNLALGSIQAVASDLVGRSITLPTIEPDEVPEESVAEARGRARCRPPGELRDHRRLRLRRTRCPPEDARPLPAAADPADRADPDPGGTRALAVDAQAANVDPVHRRGRGRPGPGSPAGDRGT